MAIVAFQSFEDNGIVEREVQRAHQSNMHLAVSTAPSGSSRLHPSMKFESRN